MKEAMLLKLSLAGLLQDRASADKIGRGLLSVNEHRGRFEIW
jgi:hypothetical protein